MDTLGITMDDNSSEIQPSFVRKTFTWMISHISKTSELGGTTGRTMNYKEHCEKYNKWQKDVVNTYRQWGDNTSYLKIFKCSREPKNIAALTL